MHPPDLPNLRLELRGRNNVLWHAIFDAFPSVAAFCRRFSLRQSVVGALLNLTQSPFQVHAPRAFRKLPLQLSAATRIPPEDLFPRALYALVTTTAVAEVDAAALACLPLHAARALTLPPTQETALQRREVEGLLTDALTLLTPNEARVIRARFGLGAQDEQTLTAVAADLGLSQERIRQIEAAALRKLRHPRVSRGLRPFLSDLDI